MTKVQELEGVTASDPGEVQETQSQKDGSCVAFVLGTFISHHHDGHVVNTSPGPSCGAPLLLTQSSCNARDRANGSLLCAHK